MKKVLIVLDSLRPGGIQRALINLLDIIDHQKFCVDLHLFYMDETRRGEINGHVNLTQARGLLRIANMTAKEARKKGFIIYMLRKGLAGLCMVLGANMVYRLLFLFQKTLKGYDTAVSFSNNINNRSVYFGCNKFVAEKVEAKRKIAWLHVDCGLIHNPYNMREYDQFDAIAAVSEAVKQSFKACNPGYKGTVKVVYNYLPEDTIRRQANAFKPEGTGGFTLVSVGRLDANKSPLSLIHAAKRLKEQNIDFKWRIIGDGPEKERVNREVIQNGLADNIVLTGELSNPYPYIQNADMLVSSSRTESFGMAIAEALLLNIPVVARYYPAIHELMTDGVSGLITEGGDEELAEAVSRAILDRELYQVLKANAKLYICRDTVSRQLDDLLQPEG